MASNLEIEKHCQFCGQRFIARTLYTKYCSHTCNCKDYKHRIREKKLNTPKKEQKIAAGTPSTFASLDNRPFLSIEETALLLGISRRSIERLIAMGLLKGGKVGSRRIISRTEIDNLIK